MKTVGMKGKELIHKDLHKKLKAGFEVIGRFDDSDIRGCNLMVL